MSLEVKRYLSPGGENEGDKGSNLESSEGLKLNIKNFDITKQFGFLDDGTKNGIFFHASNVAVSKYTMRKNAPAEIKQSTELYRIKTGVNEKGKSLISGMTPKAFHEYEESLNEELERKEEQKNKEFQRQKEYDLEAEKLKDARLECSLVESQNQSGPYYYVSSNLVFPDGTKKYISSYGHILTEERAKKDSKIATLRQEINEKEKAIHEEIKSKEEKNLIESIPGFFDEKTWLFRKTNEGEVLLYSNKYLIYVIHGVTWHSAPKTFLSEHGYLLHDSKKQIRQLFESLGGEKKIYEGIGKYETKKIIPGSKKTEAMPIYADVDEPEDGHGPRSRGNVIIGYRQESVCDMEYSYTVNGTTAFYINHEMMSDKELEKEKKEEEELKNINETKKRNITIEKYEEGRLYFSNGRNINIGQWPEIEDCIGQTVKEFKNNIVTTSAGNKFFVPEEEKYEISIGAKILKYEYGLVRFDNRRAARIGEWPAALDLVGQKIVTVKDGNIITEDGSNIGIPEWELSEFPEFELPEEEITKLKKEYEDQIQKNETQNEEKNIFTREMLYKDTSIPFLRTVISSVETPEDVRKEAALLILNQNPEKGDVYEILEQIKDENIIKESCTYLKEKLGIKRKDLQKLSERFGPEIMKFLE